jgi:hypothetical protein
MKAQNVAALQRMGIGRLPTTPIHACWECGEPVGDAQLIRSRGDLQADICHGCEFWVRAVLARIKEGR